MGNKSNFSLDDTSRKIIETVENVVQDCCSKVPETDVEKSGDGEYSCKLKLSLTDYDIFPKLVLKKRLSEGLNKNVDIKETTNFKEKSVLVSIKLSNKLKEDIKLPYVVQVKVTDEIEDEKYGHMDKERILDNFFDSIPQMLEDFDGDARYGYSSPSTVSIKFQYKDNAIDFINNLRRDIFDIKLYNRVNEKMTEGWESSYLSVNHADYVLHNVLDWDRGWDFDKRSLKQICKACARYDREYTAREYYRVIKDYDLLEKPTKYSNYRLVSDYDY